MFVSTDVKDDKEIVLSAVTQNGEAIQYASTRLQQDIDERRYHVQAQRNNTELILKVLSHPS